MRTEFEFGILGTTIVQLHGNQGVHEPRPPRVRKVLAALLVHPNRRLSFEQLAEWAWSEDEAPPDDLRSTFHTYGHRMRKSLRDWGSSARLRTGNGGWRLEVDPRRIDYRIFGELISQAHSCRAAGEHEQACELASAAVGLWRDRPLADLTSRAAENWRRSVLDHEWLPANLLLFDEQSALGRFGAALSGLDALESQGFAGLELARRRLRVLHGLSRYSEATQYYLTTHRHLRNEGQDAEADELRRFFHELAPRQDSSPPPRVTRPRLVPQDVAGFTGRDELLRTLDELTGVAAGRLRSGVVLLSGIGGIGKTVLAVRWARRASRRLSTGILFENLRGVSRSRRMEPAELVDAFLGALGFPVERIVGATGRAAKLHALLEEQPMLVVLDNVQDSAHIRPLLPLFDECAVVITSRHRLTELTVGHGVPSLTVPPLATRQGVELLASRIGDRTEEAPAELVRLCGGLPLALTLVADRAASRPGVPLSALATQLRDRDTLLHIGEDGDGTDRSLHAVFSLSYEALPVETGRLFRLLGRHPGAEFGAGLAAALVGEPVARVRRQLDELVGAHLVEQHGEADRYRMHDLLLAHAASLAETDPEAGPAALRMLNFYLHSLLNAHRAAFPHVGHPPPALLLEGVEPESFEDGHQASSWYLRERANLAAVTSSEPATSLDYGWQLPHLATPFQDRFGFYAELVTGLTRAADLLAAQRNPAAAATLNDLGYFRLTLGDTGAAAADLHRALDILAEVRVPMGELSVRINLARLEWKRGNRATAAREFAACLALARELGDTEREGKVEYYLGETLGADRLHDSAAVHFERALRLREALSDLPAQAMTLAELAHLEVARGQYADAEERCARAESLLAGVRDVAAELRLLTVRTELDLGRGRYADAVGFASRALELVRPTGKAEAEAMVLDLLGQCWAGLGEHDEARVAWLAAAEIHGGRGQEWQEDVLRRRVAALTEPLVPRARQTADSVKDHPIR